MLSCKHNKQMKQTCEFQPVGRLIKEGKYNQMEYNNL